MKRYIIGFVLGASLTYCAASWSGTGCQFGTEPFCETFDELYPKKNKDKFRVLSERDTCLKLRMQALEEAVCALQNRVDACCPSTAQ